MKKKILLISAAVIALAAVCVIGYTLAYFTDTDTATNTFTIGDVDIELTEPSWNEDALIDGDGNPIPPSLIPGLEIPKDPIVENIGKNTCYVRIIVTVNEAFDAILKESNYTFSDIIDTLGTGWVLDKDAGADNVYVFYFTSPLLPTEFTTTLFTKVTLPITFDKEFKDFEGSMDIDVLAQAIQATGFADYVEAFDAFDNPPTP